MNRLSNFGQIMSESIVITDVMRSNLCLNILMVFVLVCLSKSKLYSQCENSSEYETSMLIAFIDGRNRLLGDEYFKEDSLLIVDVFNQSDKVNSLFQFSDLIGDRKDRSTITDYELSGSLMLKHYYIYGGTITLSYHLLLDGNNLVELHCEIDAKREEAERIEEFIKLPVAHTFSKLIYYKNLVESKDNGYEHIINSCKLDADLKQLILLDLHDYRKYCHANYNEFNQLHFPHNYLSDYLKNIRYVVANKDINLVNSMIKSVVPHSKLFGVYTAKYLDDLFPNENLGIDWDDVECILEGYSSIISSGTLNCHTGKFSYDTYDMSKQFKFLLSSK